MSEFFAESINSLHMAQQAYRDQQSLGIALTRQVIVQSTTGFGHSTSTHTFDNPYVSEPTFSYGCALASISHRGVYPSASALLLKWVQNTKGYYTGVQVSLDVLARLSANFATSAQLPLATVITGVTVTMVHFLTFDGDAGPHENTPDIHTMIAAIEPVETLQQGQD